MAVIYEKPPFIDFDESGDEYRYTYHFGVKETQSPATARALARAHFGPIIQTPVGVLFLSSNTTTTSTAYNQFDVDIEYLRREDELGKWSWNFDGTGRTENVKHSLETIAKYPDEDDTPEQNSIIGFDGTSVVGADIIVPSGRFDVTFSHPAGIITLHYMRYLQNLAGYVNENPWLVWAAGEVRFIGPIGSDGTETDAQVIYQYELEANKEDFTVGDITGIDKKGWHFAWTRDYLKELAAAGGEKYQGIESKFLYVERVSEEIDFALAFGIQ